MRPWSVRSIGLEVRDEPVLRHRCFFQPAVSIRASGPRRAAVVFISVLVMTFGAHHFRLPGYALAWTAVGSAQPGHLSTSGILLMRLSIRWMSRSRSASISRAEALAISAMF